MRREHRYLLEWYKSCGRHELPWRKTRDVYRVYLSEIMLQQTQVNRVKEYFYPNFLDKYPTLSELANANLNEVLANWSGLGYYSRARNLYKTAKLTSELPNSQKELLQLPGIGKYTASAICSFALEQNVSVVDTNIARVLKRYFALYNPKESFIWEKADAFLNHKNPREHNLALMDLGSLICKVKNPLCKECPLEKNCQGKYEPEVYTLSKKTQYEQMELFLGVRIKNKKIAFVKSTEKLYKDMLVLPSIEPIEEDFLGSFKHSYTKYRLIVNLYASEYESDESIWISLEEENMPISSMSKKALKLIQKLL